MSKISNQDFFRIYQKLDDKSARVEINRVEKNNWYLAQVFVPSDYRLQGITTGFLADILTWADEKQIALFTNINSSDDLIKTKIAEILKQHGFKQVNDIWFTRKPILERVV